MRLQFHRLGLRGHCENAALDLPTVARDQLHVWDWLFAYRGRRLSIGLALKVGLPLDQRGYAPMPARGLNLAIACSGANG